MSDQYTDVDNAYYDDVLGVISPGAYVCLSYIIRDTAKHHCERGNFSYQQMALALSLARNTVVKALQELASVGLIAIDDDTAMGHTYTLLPPEQWRLPERVPTITFTRHTPSNWRELRETIFQRDDYTCQYCGQVGGELHCDHVVPLSRGGTSDPENLVTACPHCNASKSTKTLEEWQV